MESSHLPIKGQSNHGEREPWDDASVVREELGKLYLILIASQPLIAIMIATYINNRGIAITRLHVRTLNRPD